MPSSSPEEEAAAAVLQRGRRKTAGQRMTSLVGKAQEEDDAFWGHETWADDDADSGNESFRDSDEDSAMKIDEFDSDFNDSESDNEEEERAAGEEEERELKRQERNRSTGGGGYVDIKARTGGGGRGGGGARKRGKRIMGDGMNAGLVLNFPPSIISGGTAAATTTTLFPATTTSMSSQQQPPPPTKKIARKLKGSASTVITPRETRSKGPTKRLRETRSTAPTKGPLKRRSSSAADGTSSSKKSNKKRRLYRQEELLIEAVNETEPENQRWLLGRQRVKDIEDKDKDMMLSLRDRARGKIIQKYHSGRGCLITLTFPEMDSVPDILTRTSTSSSSTITTATDTDTATNQSKENKALCVITGKPARYRDPKTNLGYYDVEAFKELRRRVDAKEPLEQRKKRVPSSSSTTTATTTKEAKQKNNQATTTTKMKTSNNMSSPIPQKKELMMNQQEALVALSKLGQQQQQSNNNNNNNNTTAAVLSPTSRRRLSPRSWKPSEKMINNIITNQHVKMAERTRTNNNNNNNNSTTTTTISPVPDLAMPDVSSSGEVDTAVASTTTAQVSDKSSNKKATTTTTTTTTNSSSGSSTEGNPVTLKPKFAIGEKSSNNGTGENVKVAVEEEEEKARNCQKEGTVPKAQPIVDPSASSSKKPENTPPVGIKTPSSSTAAVTKPVKPAGAAIATRKSSSKSAIRKQVPPTNSKTEKKNGNVIAKNGNASVAKPANKAVTDNPVNVNSSSTGNNKATAATITTKTEKGETGTKSNPSTPTKSPPRSTRRQTKGQIAKAQAEQVYILPKDDGTGNQQSPQIITQSELIIQVIDNYSKAHDKKAGGK